VNTEEVALQLTLKAMECNLISLPQTTPLQRNLTGFPHEENNQDVARHINIFYQNLLKELKG